MASLSTPPVSAKEQVLVEMSQWLARVLQYSPGHPSCLPLAQRTHQALGRALALEAPLEYGILKDDVVMGDDRAMHRATKTRIGPYLHERGVLLLRFAYGVTTEELGKLIEILAQPAQSIFDAGGLLRLAVDRGVSRITFEEIAHDITDEEREEQKRRKRMRAFFSEMLRRMLAHRGLGLLVGDQLVELLDHPDVAVRIIEDDAQGVAEAVACLSLLVRQEEAKGQARLLPKLVKVLSLLSPDSRDRVILGFPPLVGDFRQALAWAMEGLDERELARFAFPSLHAHALELEPVLYALSVLLPHDGTRLSVCRLLALSLTDLASDEPGAERSLAALAAPVAAYDSFRRERECLRGPAAEALAMREVLRSPTSASPAGEEGERPRFDGRGSVFELVRLSGRMRDFDAFVPRLQSAMVDYAMAGSIDVVIGILRGLRGVATEAWRKLAEDSLRSALTPELVAKVLLDVDRASARLEGQELEELVDVTKLFAAACPADVFERLERSESRKMRRILLEALPLAGASLQPILRSRLIGAPWYVTRNAVLLLGRVGATPADLSPAARHPNERVRFEVARAVRAMAPDAAGMDILASYLLDGSQEIAQSARAGLRGELLGPTGIQELARLAEDEKTSDELRRYSVKQLGLCPLDPAASSLFRLLHPKGLLEIGSASSGYRELVAAALHGSPAPAARGLFKQGLSSPVWRVRKACERASEGPAS